MSITRKDFFIWAIIGLAVFLPTAIKPGAFYYEFGMWFLSFHAVAEIFTIAIAMSLGLYTFYVYKLAQSRRFLVFCIVFIASAVVDILHTLTYGGMPQTIFFPSTNTAIYFWLTARAIVAIGLLVAAFVKPSAKSGFSIVGGIIVSCLVGAATFLILIFLTPQLPAMANVFGLTATKITIERILMVTFALAALLYWREAKKSGGPAPYALLLFFLFTIFSEYEFTLYPGAYYFQNLLGHVFKMAAYGFLLAYFAPQFKKFLEVG